MKWARTRSCIAFSSVIAGLLVVMVVLPSGALAAAIPDQQTGPALPSTSLVPTEPVFTTFAGQPVVEVTYTNHLNTTATFIVYGVFHNSVGQTILMTTSTVTIMTGGNQTAYLVVSLLSAGVYRATIFATTTEGVVVSPASSLNLEAA